MKAERKRFLLAGVAAVIACMQFTACSGGSSSSGSSSSSSAADSSTAADVSEAGSSSAADEGGDSSGAMMSSEEIVKSAAAAGMVGNWGLGNEYEIQALLTKYGLPTDYITQDFTMDQFDSDSVTLASAMTYNELGLVKNSYDGGYGYGDSVSVIDMNDEGVAMLEDNLFTSKAFAEANPNTVKAFVSASMKGWAYACEHPDEAAEIVFEAGSSVSADHQAYMASEVAKLVTTDMNGNAVSASDVGNMDETAMQQTLDLAKQYIILEDSAAKDKLASLTLDDIRSTDFLTYDPATDGAPEKTSVSVQLKWLPQAQSMSMPLLTSLSATTTRSV